MTPESPRSLTLPSPATTTTDIKNEVASPDCRPLILVIEDDLQAGLLMAEHLNSGGYQVAHATTGTAAMQMALQLKPSAITLDILLPDANGMDILAGLKANPANSHIPVIIVTVSDDRQLGLSLGATQFFVKPVGADKLLEALASARAAARKEIQNVLVVDDEAEARESITAILTPRGFAVQPSASGEEALRLIIQHVPDLAIVDLTMPGMSGFELVNHLRQNPSTREMPICIYTAKDLSPAETRWLSERSAAITPKPFREQLMAELERICSSTV